MDVRGSAFAILLFLCAGVLHLAGGDGEPEFPPPAFGPTPFMTPLETRRQTGHDLVYPIDTVDSWLTLSKAAVTFPVFLNSIPLVFQTREGQNKRHAVLNFLYSQGFAATKELFEFHLLPSVSDMEAQVNALEQEMKAKSNVEVDMNTNAAGVEVEHNYGQKMRDQLPITMAVGVHQRAFLLQFDDPGAMTKEGALKEVYIRQQALEFLHSVGTDQPEQQPIILDALIGQMSVRANLRDEAWCAFFPDNKDPVVGDEHGSLGITNDKIQAPSPSTNMQVEWNWTSVRMEDDSIGAGSPNIMSTYATLLSNQKIRNREVPVWILNLWRSPVRRLHMLQEIEREGLQSEARLFHGVDGLALSDMVIQRLIGKYSVLSTGEIGCFMTHLTSWREIERQALPFAVILEDDSQLKPGFRENLYSMLHTITETDADWDVLFLEECREMRAEGPDLDCRKPYMDMAKATADGVSLNAGLLDIGGSRKGTAPMCVPSGVRAYAVSYRGAQKLAAAAVPIRWAIDVYMGEMIYQRNLRVFCTLPSLVELHKGGTVRSDTASAPVFHTKSGDGKIHYTANPSKGFPSCDSMLCVLHFQLQGPHNQSFNVPTA